MNHRADATLLVRQVTLVDTEGAPQEGQDILVSDGRIAWIAPAGTRTVDDDVVRVDGAGGICMPGLVNTHNHTPLTIVRGMVEDIGFAPAYTPGIPQGHWLSEEETCLLARLGLLELLKAGCTTVVDYYRCPDALARAAEEIGLRAFVGGRIMDVDTAALARGEFEVDRALGESTLADSQDLIERWDGASDGLIRTFHAPHAPDTCSPDLLARVSELASDGRMVHTHLAQSPLERERVLARDGRRPSEVLDHAGLLDHRLFAAHCIFLDEDEVRRVGAARSVVCHAPAGNAAFGALAPITDLADAGAVITLCTDTKTADMFESMRMAIAVARIRAGSEFALDARTVLAWATGGGANALGLAANTGRIAAGAPADLVVLEAHAPNLFPVVDGHGIIAHSASAGNVRHVICAGRWLLADGEPTRVDAAEIVASASAVARRLWARARA